jgi:hypothetical protein
MDSTISGKPLPWLGSLDGTARFWLEEEFLLLRVSNGILQAK